MRLTRSDVKRNCAHLEIPFGDPFRYGEKRDFVGDIVGGIGDAIGGVVDAVVSNPIISTVAAAVFPPLAPFVAGMNVASGIINGNPLQAIGGAIGLSGAGGWFDVPIDSASAMEAFTSLPLEAQNAYFAAGYSPLDVGTALAQDSSYMSAFQGLPYEAQQAYLDAGYQPNQIGSSLLQDQARDMGLWGKLPAEAQQAYLDAGYSPQDIGGYLASDATVAAGGSGGLLSGVKTAYNATKAINSLFGGDTGGSLAGRLLSGGLGAIGGALTGNAAVDAAKIKAQSDLATAQTAADAAKFKPYGMTTFAGASNFQKDAQGNVIGANYSAAPWAKAQQDALLGQSNQMLSQYQNAPSQFAPMGAAGQRAMALGNQYLAQDPQAQAMKYMQDQQALLATGRDRDASNMLTGEFNRGTYGLATGATGQMGAANPRLEAMYNAQRQQDLGLAAQATQGGMDYAKFGAGMVGTGGDLTRGMYTGQTAAFDPYKTALGGATTIEGLAQQPLTLGADLGKMNMNSGAAGLLMQGGLSANNSTQQANAYSPWGNMLSGAANQVQNYNNQQQQQQYAFNPFTGARL
jgi:hypothetical protein